MKIRTVFLSTALAFAAMSPVHAGGKAPASFAATAPVTAASATPAQRGNAIRQFVRKWGAYVQTVYDVDVQAWAMRLVPQFAHGEPANLHAALQRQTFEGAMAALNGVGHRLSDDRVIAALAALPPGASARQSKIVARALGDTHQDLVYTPIQPCRIVDTRNTLAGAIAGEATRSFSASGIASYAGQGGSATNCGMNAEAPSAVALNVTAVTPAGAGYATVFPYGTTRPDTASVNYAGGDIVNSAIISRIPTPAGSFDFSIYSFAQSHYVVDIVGYFDNPRATPVACVNTTLNVVSVAPGATANLTATGVCPAGYGTVGLNCESGSGSMPLLSVSGSICSARNNGGIAADLRAGRRCCQIPGR